MLYYGDQPRSAGVQYVPDQTTDAAARQAVEPQAHGDEFKPKPNPDRESIISRLETIETDRTELHNKLYMGKSPTYLERETIHSRLRVLDKECYALRALLSQIDEAMDKEEPGSPFKGDATVIE